ncbi:MAG: efflux RND transporter periplasmic adaptor subunit [Chitinophagales bacterium]
MKMRKVLIAGLLLAAVAVIACYLAFQGTELNTADVTQGNIIRTVEDDGYVQAVKSYGVFATQSGRVTKVPIEIGQTVKKGDLLVIMENVDLDMQSSDLSSQLAQAQASVKETEAGMARTKLELENANQNLKRVEDLYNEGAATRVEYDQAQLIVDSGQQALDEYEARLQNIKAQVAGMEKSLNQIAGKTGELVLTSPAAGIVYRLEVEEQQVVTPGTLLASIGTTGKLEIKANILSDDMARIKIGQPVTISSPVLLGKNLAGKVKKIYPQAEEELSALGVVQHRVPVLISIPETSSLKPGYEVRISIQTEKRENVLVLPRESVITLENGQKQVMVILDNRIKHRIIKTGASDNDHIEIMTGLKVGDKVVEDGSTTLKEDTRVKL